MAFLGKLSSIKPGSKRGPSIYSLTDDGARSFLFLLPPVPLLLPPILDVTANLGELSLLSVSSTLHLFTNSGFSARKSSLQLSGSLTSPSPPRAQSPSKSARRCFPPTRASPCRTFLTNSEARSFSLHWRSLEGQFWSCSLVGRIPEGQGSSSTPELASSFFLFDPSLILPPPLIINPHQPLTEEQFATLQARSPLNPANPNYMSLVGERRAANGYPVSSWRWLKVSREWWSIIRAELWRDCVVGGYDS